MYKIIKLSIIFLVLGSILISGCIDSEKPSEIDGQTKPVQNEELNEDESLTSGNTDNGTPKAKALISDENGIGYDDGIKDSEASLGTKTGHAVFYSIDEKIMVDGINIYGCRYDDLSKDFDIEIWDGNFNNLYSGSFNYDSYFPESFAPTTDSCFKWVTVDIPDIEVNDDFYLMIFTQSVKPSWVEGEPLPDFINGGIEIGVDKNTESGNSFMVEKNPNRIVDWPSWNLKQDSTDWMLRVLSK